MWNSRGNAENEDRVELRRNTWYDVRAIHEEIQVAAIGHHAVAGDAGHFPAAAAAALLRRQEEEEEEAGQDVQHKLQVGRIFAILFIPDHIPVWVAKKRALLTHIMKRCQRCFLFPY